MGIARQPNCAVAMPNHRLQKEFEGAIGVNQDGLDPRIVPRSIEQLDAAWRR